MPAEIVRMHVHNPQRDVSGAGMEEARSSNSAGRCGFGQNAAAGVEVFVNFTKKLNVLRPAREDRRLAGALIPVVGGNLNQLSDLGPIGGKHGAQPKVGHEGPPYPGKTCREGAKKRRASLQTNL